MTQSHSKEWPGSILQLHCCKLLSLHNPLSHSVTARCLSDSFKMSPTSHYAQNGIRWKETDFFIFGFSDTHKCINKAVIK